MTTVSSYFDRFTSQQALPFRDRRQAGSDLAVHLSAYGADRNVLVLGLPRGGVPVAFEIAHRLEVRLDVFLVRKLGAPGRPELAMGAIASGGVRVLNHDVIDELDISQAEIDAVAVREQGELERRERKYCDGRPKPAIAGRKVILVDDGLATGSTMRAALSALRQHNPARVIVAVPVAAHEAVESLRAEADEVVCAYTPEPFMAVGRWYRDFSPTMDGEIHDLLEQAELEQLARH